jgi:peptide/nickel transport system substrate-binding protein
VVALALLCALLAALSAPAAPTDPRPDLRVRLQFQRPGGIYDPARALSGSDQFVLPSFYNRLVRPKPDSPSGDVEPDLAERWTVSSDGLIYTFYLRRGVRFHRGFGELTADDVAFTFQRQMGNRAMRSYAELQDVAAVEALDHYTVRIRLVAPNASLIPGVVAGLTGYIVSRRAVDQLGEEFARNPVGTGPYAFERLTAGREISVLAHDGCFRGRPEVQRIVFAHIAEEVIAAAALLKGEFQVIWTRGNPEAVRMLREAHGVGTERVAAYDSLRHVAFSPRFAPAQDVRVRRALSHAINRQQIAAAMPGLEMPTDAIRSLHLVGGGGSVPRYAYSQQRARALLAEAGYPRGLRVRLLHQTRDLEIVLAQIVDAGWRAVGLDVVLEPMEATATLDRKMSRDFEATVDTVTGIDPNHFFTRLFHSAAAPPAAFNYLGYDDADDLIAAARRETDPTRRRALYERLHRQLMTDLPVIPLSNQVAVAAWRDPVAGMVNGRNNQFWSETIRIRRP